MRDLVGQFGVTQIGGLTGVAVGAGQGIIRSRGPHIREYHRRFSHTLYVRDEHTVIEAVPGGVRETPLSKYTTGRLGRITRFSTIQVTDEDKARLAGVANSMLDRPYGWLNYPALSLEHLGARPGWLVDYIQSTDNVICSQTTDLIYFGAGIHLYSDDRLFLDVVPYDLAAWQDDHPNWIPIRSAA